jgi:hypothetical protein
MILSFLKYIGLYAICISSLVRCFLFISFLFYSNLLPILFIFLFSIFFFYCCTGGILWHLHKFLWHIIVEFTPPSFSFIPRLPIPGIVSTGLIFPFSYITIFVPYSPFYTLSWHPPCSHWYQPGPALSSCSSFVGGKKRHSCLSNYTESFLVPFPCMYEL